jgi:polyisoprenyl-phosphate glycosyltransferase
MRKWSKKHNWYRNLGSNAVQWAIRQTFNIKNPVTAYRLLTKALRDRVITHTQGQVYIEGLFYWHSSAIATQPVQHYKREEGKSNYNLLRLLKLAMNLIFNFSTLPLRLINYTGFALGALSLAFGIYFIFRKVMFNVPLGYTSIIVTLLFSTSVIVTMIGITAQYLGRIYSVMNQRPQFSVKETL